MYWRIFPTRFMKIGCISLASLSSIWCVSVLFAATFQCKPIAKSWDATLPGRCIDYAESFVVFIASSECIYPNIVIDILILGLPIWEIAKLHITGKQRLALLFVFLLGALVTVASGVRLYYQTQLIKLGSEKDITCKCTICLPKFTQALGPMRSNWAWQWTFTSHSFGRCWSPISQSFAHACPS